MRMTREGPMIFVPGCQDRTPFPRLGIPLRTTLFAGLFLLAAARSPAQSTPGAGQASPRQEPAPASKADAAPKAKPKKVYTNDDLQKSAVQEERPSSPEIDYYAGLLKCDDSCEQQASTEVSLGHDHVSGPAAWQEQIVISRKRLAADLEWREQLRKMIELMRIYCNDINPQSNKGTPGAKGYDARTAGEAEAYMKRTGRSLDESFQIQASQLRARVNEVRFSDPATGALMNVQTMRVMQCAPYVP